MNIKQGEKLTKKQKKMLKMTQKHQKTQQKEFSKQKGKDKIHKDNKNDHQYNQQLQIQEGQDIDFNNIDQNENQNIQVSFLVAQIQQQHYHSLKTILLRLAQNLKLTNSQIADQVVQNKLIGNVVLADDDQQDDDQLDDDQQQNEQDDELNVYSVLTVLLGNKKLSKQIKKHVSKVSGKKVNQQIIQIINNVSTNILINQRLSNLPAFVVNHSHQIFKKDMKQLKKNNKQQYKQLFSGYLLNISQIQYEGQDDLDKLVFSKFEDYQMCKRAKIWWLGDRNKSFKKKTDMRNLYYLIEGQQYLQGIQMIKNYLKQ